MASNDSLQRSVLPIPDRRPVTLTTYDAKDPDTKFPRSHRCGRPPVRRTCSWSCSTMLALAHRARLVARVRPPQPSGLQRKGWSTTAASQREDACAS